MPTRQTILKLSITLERIEVIRPSSAPFRAARPVVETTGETVRESELPSRPVGNVRPVRVPYLRRVG